MTSRALTRSSEYEPEFSNWIPWKMSKPFLYTKCVSSTHSPVTTKLKRQDGYWVTMAARNFAPWCGELKIFKTPPSLGNGSFIASVENPTTIQKWRMTLDTPSEKFCRPFRNRSGTIEDYYCFFFLLSNIVFGTTIVCFSYGHDVI